jgi:hypothetical protein
MMDLVLPRLDRLPLLIRFRRRRRVLRRLVFRCVERGAELVGVDVEGESGFFRAECTLSG